MRWLCIWALLIVCIHASNVYAHPDDEPTPGEHHQHAAPELVIPAKANLIAGEVVRIFDGDTILIRIDGKNRRYQLIGADAPEYVPKDKKPKPFSIESMRFIEQLLLGENVYVQHDPAGTRDSSGQLRAYVFRAPDMLFVNLELIRQGYAKHSSRHGTIYQDSFSHYQLSAKEKNRGIWDTHQRFRTEQPVEDAEEEQASPETSEPTQKNEPISKPAREQSRSADAIYITKSGSKYHRETCPHLTASRQRTSRDKVDSTHAPCKTCKPDDSDS